MGEFIDLGGRLINRALIATVEYDEAPLSAVVCLAVPIYDQSDDGTGGTDMYSLRLRDERARVLLHALMPTDTRWWPEAARAEMERARAERGGA